MRLEEIYTYLQVENEENKKKQLENEEVKAQLLAKVHELKQYYDFSVDDHPSMSHYNRRDSPLPQDSRRPTLS